MTYDEARANESAGHGVVYWVTGRAGAGKTTIGRRLAARLRELGRTVALLDGDELRAACFPDAGYEPAERRALAERYSRLCGLLAAQGLDVVCATISLYPEIWERNRRSFADYREILLRAPLEVLARRKPSLYGPLGGEDGDGVVGQDPPAREPPDPDVSIVNDGDRSPEQVVDELLARLGPEATGSSARRA